MSIDHDPLVIADEDEASRAAEQALEVLALLDVPIRERGMLSEAAEAMAIDNAHSGEHRHRLADLPSVLRNGGLRAEMAARSPSPALERLEGLVDDRGLVERAASRVDAALPAALQRIEEAIEDERREAAERFARGDHLPRSRGEIAVERRSPAGKRRPPAPREDPLDESLFRDRRR